MGTVTRVLKRMNYPEHYSGEHFQEIHSSILLCSTGKNITANVNKNSFLTAAIKITTSLDI